MRKILLTTLVMMVFGTFSNAQNFIHEFGKYSSEEFDLKQYDKDPSAEAVVLYDIGQAYFTIENDELRMIFERKTKIKIFNKAGLRWSEFEIPYYEKNSNPELITDLAGNTYNFENGKVAVTPLDLKNTYVEKVNENARMKKFAMPNVKEGSIIEIKYTVSSPYFFNFRSWEFQSRIPTIFSEYTTKMTPFYTYNYILQGALKFDAYNSFEEFTTYHFGNMDYHNMVYVFTMKNVPAFKDESFITSINDYILKIDFQLSQISRTDGSKQQIMTTWPKLIEDLLDDSDFGRYLKSCSKKAKEIIDTMKLETKSIHAKAAAIDNLIKSNFSWNGYSRIYPAKSFREFLKSKTGNSSEINLFYVALLNAAGIEAYPVLISTRNNGKIKYKYPFEQFFNSEIVLAKVENNSLLLDATDPLTSFNEIPVRCLNEKGLIIKKDKVKYDWVDLQSNIASKMEYNIVLDQLVEGDSIMNKVQVKSMGYDALNLRWTCLYDKKNLKNEIPANNMRIIDSAAIGNLHQIDSAFYLKLTAVSSVDRIEDKILISPFTGFVMTDNPLKQAFRTYPIDLVYKHMRVFSSTIHLPDGFKVLSKPSNFEVNNELIQIHYAVEDLNDNSFKVSGSYEFKQDTYGVLNYMKMKWYFDKIIELFNTKIVLVKK
jgi:transglutaminase-like putative cysteine protease